MKYCELIPFEVIQIWIFVDNVGKNSPADT